MLSPNDEPLVRLWLASPGMREPARIARELGHDLDSSLARIRDQVTDRELAEWLRAALRR